MRQWAGESVADGRYAIGDVLGRGRDARVHRAEDRVLHRSVAVKFFPATASGRIPSRWRTEAAALDRFDHQHIVRLLDGGQTADAAYLVLPLLPGTLAARLDDGPMTRAEAARVVLALADALGRVHRAGLVHGDVDVDGVLIDELGLPCWGGLPDPVTGTRDSDVERAVERDLAGLAALAVRCVAGEKAPTTAPASVLDVVRAAAAAPGAPDLHDRLTGALESAVPAQRTLAATPFVTAARRRARPGFAAVLGLGFAASVLAGLVVDTGTWRATIGDGLGDTPGALVLSDDPASSDIASSVRDAIGRLGSLPDDAATPRADSEASGSPVSGGGNTVTGGSGDPVDPVGSTTSGDADDPDLTDVGAQRSGDEHGSGDVREPVETERSGGVRGDGGADGSDGLHRGDRAAGSDEPDGHSGAGSIIGDDRHAADSVNDGRGTGDDGHSGAGGGTRDGGTRDGGTRDGDGQDGDGQDGDGHDGGGGHGDGGGYVELRADGGRAGTNAPDGDDVDGGADRGDSAGDSDGDSAGERDGMSLSALV